MRRAVAIVGGLALATALSQFPEYAQQYTQRLGGAVDELRLIVEDFDRAAVEGGLDRSQALARYGASTDTFIAGRGRSMSGTLIRYERLSAALDEIENADALERLQNLPLYLDTDIGVRTLAAYKPAIPVTPEGFLYAFSGLVLGYLVTSGVFRLVTLPFARRGRRTVYR